MGMIRVPQVLSVLFLLTELSAGVQQPVEILRDRWGVPHIYAQNTHDLFFAQGYITAKDRLFQIDLWRRTGTGKLAEVLGPSAVPRDRIARLVRFRGNWDEEWKSYSPDAKAIATAFTEGINAYIGELKGQRTPEFTVAGYDPGLWEPEDVTARIAGLLMTGNMGREVQRAMDITQFGLSTVQSMMPSDPFRALDPAKGLDLRTITSNILRDYTAAIGPVLFPGEQGSNNWVVDGQMTATGKPILANDPHRPIQMPSLRKTVHLVAPGWNVIGAGEPALPGVALGHNEEIAYGFTIVGIDQQDLYVEKLKPSDATQYRYRGAWKKMEVERQSIAVKGEAARQVELRYTLHGPVIQEDAALHRAYALRWVGSQPGGAGYLAALAVARAANWAEFRKEVARYKVPSENLVYADRAGNIGWIAAGLAPIRKNWSGLLPVPGDSGKFEWDGFLSVDDLPQSFNPSRHFIATANHKILPEGYTKQLSYEWAAPDRFLRIASMLSAGAAKFQVADFERMQQNVDSVSAHRFLKLLPKDSPLAGWDGYVSAESPQALLYELWTAALPTAVFGRELGARVTLQRTLSELEARPNADAIEKAYQAAQARSAKYGAWGDLHQVTFRHPLRRSEWNRGPVARPGDANTVNATGGPNFTQTAGASYRQVIDLADWDKSTMTNVPGESGDPASKHYDDLIQGWAAGKYHPMPYSRKAVEAAMEERIMLRPAR